MGETVSAGIVPVLLPVSAWWPLLETRWSTSADSLLSDEAWHCDPFSCILCSFMAFTGLPAASAEGSPIPILLTGHFDLLSFVITACEKMISQLASLDLQNIWGSLM